MRRTVKVLSYILISSIVTSLVFASDKKTEEELFKNKQIDVIVGIESRGFIFAAPLSLKLGCKFALARKPGKLPSDTISEKYELEYGTDAIEMHKDAINDGDNVLIVDDLLATGGTAKATGSLVKRLSGKIVSYAFVIELVELNGADLLETNPVLSIVKY